MDPKFIFLSYMFIAGFFGMASRLYIAGFLLSTESIRSPQPVTRYRYRFLVFSYAYLVSFFISPALFNPLIPYMVGALGGAPPYLLPLLCLPLAMLIYWLDCKYIVWADAAKMRARKRLFSRKG